MRFGRLGEPALWIIVALGAGPRTTTRLLDDVRSMDGQVGPGTLYGAVARLEGLALIERVVLDQGGAGYRLRERHDTAAPEVSAA